MVRNIVQENLQQQRPPSTVVFRFHLLELTVNGGEGGCVQFCPDIPPTTDIYSSRTVGPQSGHSLCLSGVGGNLVAVQASRISTYLHINGVPMGDPNPNSRKCPTPWASFLGSCKFMDRDVVGIIGERFTFLLLYLEKTPCYSSIIKTFFPSSRERSFCPCAFPAGGARTPYLPLHHQLPERGPHRPDTHLH